MGSDNSKPNVPQPSMTDVLVNMKMKSKTFQRESNKAMKEKEAYYKKAKEQLKKGNQEGAQMFLEMVQQKQNEAMQYMKVGTRLEVIAGQIKSKNKSMEMMQDLSKFTPILMQSNQQMSLEQMMHNMQGFTNAYDDLVVKGHIIDQTMDKTLGEKNAMSNVDNLMQDLKNEVALDMGVSPSLQEPAMQQ